ncbi:MAG: tyrosine-type recombinase/integrase [Fimbriimonadia bacterium]|jgi:integrase/recombinase XerC
MANELAPRTPFEAPVAPTDALEMLLCTKRSEVTRLAYQRDLNQFFRFHTGSPPTPETVAQFFRLDTACVTRALLAFKVDQLERGVAEVTLNRRLSAVWSLLRVARQLGLTEVNPHGLVPGEKVQQYRDTRGVPTETAALMLSLPDTTTVKGKRDAAILRLLWELALRRTEVCKLQRFDFDPVAKTLSVHGKGKGTQAVLMTLSDRVVAAIQDYLAARDDNHPSLFLSCNRFKDGRHQGLKDWTVAHIVKEYAELAGLKHFSPHRWRHTSITAYLLATNGDVRGAQKLSRHSKLETLMIYDDAREDLQGRATRLLSELA